MEKKVYIDAYPNKIILSKNFEKNYYESKINLTNLTNNFVVFKVFINKSQLYSANPSTSFIPPRESKYINIKRKSDRGNEDTSKDKFLIMAFPSENQVKDNQEATALVNKENIKDPNNQEIYLEAEFETFTGNRMTMADVQPKNRISTITEAEPFPVTRSPDETDFNSNPGLTSGNDAEDIKKQIEELKKKIQELESQNEKYNHQLNNLNLNSQMFKNKTKGKQIYF